MLVVPVFATTCPRTGGFSHPVLQRSARAGDGQRAQQHSLQRRLACDRLEDSDERAGVSRSCRERPEPSTIRTPFVGMPASSSAVMTTCAPAALPALRPRQRPSSLSSCSAVKLSLCRSM